MSDVTVTISRPTADITVALRQCPDGHYEIVEVLDEDGTTVPLTPSEEREALSLACAGVDETGR